MTIKIIAGIIAAALMLAYLLPPAYKLHSVALVVVILIGVVMMLVDLWQSLREND